MATVYVLLFKHFEQLLLRPPSISQSWLLGDQAPSQASIQSIRVTSCRRMVRISRGLPIHIDDLPPQRVASGCAPRVDGMRCRL